MYAPIALFTYNRADKTQRVLESLIQNAEAKDSDLFIFSDGPKNDKAVEGVKANREYIHTVTGFKSVTIIEREKNWGLANSLIAGITEVINKYGKVIVVEDDLILSPYFLKFMNDGLEKYKEEPRVGAISAYVPSNDKNLPENYFLRYFHCWGWATWKHGWDLLNTDTKYLLRKMRFKKNEFDVGGNAGAYGNLLCQKYGLVDSWWVRFYASLFLADKLTLYPRQALAVNNGLDGSGTHSKESTVNQTKISSTVPIRIDDILIVESKEAYMAFKAAFDINAANGSYITVTAKKFKSFIRRLFYIDCM